MQFLVSWQWRVGIDGEAAAKRAMQLFGKWSPPAGIEFKAFLQRTDGNGGFALVETDNPALLLEAPAKFGAHMEFTQVPVMDIMESMAVAQEGIDFRESIS